MALPSSGSISMSQINTELSLTATAQISLNTTAVRGLIGRTGDSTQISLADGYGKSSRLPDIYVQYLLVGGGGGGATGTYDNIGGGGGGGGGGGIYMNDANLNAKYSFSITIGQGGAAGFVHETLYITGYYKGGAPSYSPAYIRASAGGRTTISGSAGTAYAEGGQPGLARWYWNGSSNPQETNTYRGGDGGWGLYAPYGLSTPGYLGWQVGNAGGAYRTNGGSDGKRAGGGGGGTDDTNNTWTGGNGAQWFDGNYYGGGGGGGGDYSYGGPGGAGGGGHGGSGIDAVTNGTDGYGGGGGGGRSVGGYAMGPGARGGSGCVVIRYAGTVAKASGGSITYSGGYVYHRFTSNGSFTVNSTY